MHRLAALGALAGGLMTIRHPYLIKRYNAALREIADCETKLSSFRIDASGFSPEIADELGNQEYMNPLGVNRKFILLNVRQKNLPVLDSKFTDTRSLIKAFIQENEQALFTLTSKDAVFGELEDSTFKIKKVEDLLSIQRIQFSVRTPSGLLQKISKLSKMVQNFVTSDTMWMEESTISTMVALGRDAGDVRRNVSIPQKVLFTRSDFHSSHLGGVYVFGGSNEITIIHEDPDLPAPGIWQNKPVKKIAISDTDRIIDFLLDRNFIRTPTVDYVVDIKEQLLQKMEFLVVDHISRLNPDMDLGELDFDETKSYIYDHHDELPVEFHELANAIKYCDAGLMWDVKDCRTSTIAYLTIAEVGPNQDLVNHLLAHLTPCDYYGTWMHNEQLFAKRWQSWPESCKGYIDTFLKKRRPMSQIAVFDAVYDIKD